MLNTEQSQSKPDSNQNIDISWFELDYDQYFLLNGKCLFHEIAQEIIKKNPDMVRNFYYYLVPGGGGKKELDAMPLEERREFLIEVGGILIQQAWKIAANKGIKTEKTTEGTIFGKHFEHLLENLASRNQLSNYLTQENS